MDTREKILEATERLIKTRGLARATTKEIAREAGCAEGTLYRHFESKEDLFLGIIQESLTPFLETFYRYQAGSNTVYDNLMGIAQALLTYYEQIIPLAASFFADAELLKRYQDIMEQSQSGPMALYHRLATYIKEEQDLGRVQATVDPLSASSLLLGASFQYAFMCRFTSKQKPLQPSDQQYLQGLVQTLLQGIQPSGQQKSEC